MSEPFVAEIRIFAGNFAPRGWAFCDGQLLPIANNTALFSLIGTTYGGDGRTTTALPDLQDRAPMHPGKGPGLTPRRLGQKTGTYTVTVSEEQIPSHTHQPRSAAGFSAEKVPSANTVLGNTFPFGAQYQKDTTADLADLSSAVLSDSGGGQAHSNMQPFLTLSFIIALAGVYPSRS